MKKILVFLLALAFIFPLSGCGKKENLEELGKNLSNYQIDISLDCEAKQANLKQTVEYRNNTNKILRQIKFHLYPQFFEEGGTERIVPSTKMNNAYPNGISFADFNISRVKANNIEQTPKYENVMDSILVVDLDKSLLPDETAEIFIEYSFALPNCCHRFGYGESTINLANFYPIACVYQVDQFSTNPYNSNGDPFYSDIANYCVNITLNKQYIVASTGEKETENVVGESKTLSFKALMVRDFAILASNKFKVKSQEHDGLEINYFYIDDTNPEKSLNAGIDAIKTFSKLFGKYPYSTYSIVQCDFIHGGMEYPNLVMISADIKDSETYLNVIIHETAHQWWYGLVGNDEFSYPWLDEALTEFSTVLFYDHNKGYALKRKAIIQASKENYTLFVTVYEDVLGSLDTSMRGVNEYSTEPEYTYCTYVKGILMFDSLYQLIGEKAFLKAVQSYFNDYKFKNTTPNDLVSSFEKTTNKNLNNFFDSWIKGKVVIR